MPATDGKDEGRVEPLSLATRAWNFAAAVAQFAADGCTTVSREQYQARLAVCERCEQREGNFCNACGCVLALKAGMRSEDCPLGRWNRPAATDLSTPQPSQPQGE
jgi:hypothetical protein